MKLANKQQDGCSIMELNKCFIQALISFYLVVMGASLGQVSSFLTLNVVRSLYLLLPLDSISNERIQS